jgi:hypothetical protein
MDGRDLPARIARAATAIVVSGLVAGTCFLIVIQEAERRGHTDLDFNHTLGNIVEGRQAEDATTRAALGVIGDSAAPTGLIATWVLSVVVMLVYAVAVVGLVRRGWIVRGVILGAATFLAVGLIYPPLASRHLEESLGPFGSGFGAATVVAFLLASLVFGIVGARCHDLIVSAWWWTPRGEDLEEALDELEMGRPASLELAEQRGEDGGVRT